jgi:hypothetical protein
MSVGSAPVRGTQSQQGGKATRTMLDIIFITITALFFAVAVLYVRACERLR